MNSFASKMIFREKRCTGFMSIFFVYALIFSLGLPLMADAASKPPSGFITLSESPMTWADAKAFCQQQGGSLPRINNSDSWNGDTEAAIDGFGASGDPWPSGLPDDLYWTGTAYTDFPGRSWIVLYNGGNAKVYSYSQSDVSRAACVR